MSFQHKIPSNLIPEDSVCYPLFVPNDRDYIALLTRAIRTVTFDRHYQRDDDNSALVVREQFLNTTYLPLITSIENDDFCCDDSDIGACFKMDTSTDAIQFFYNDPFVSIDENRPKLGQWERYQDIKDNMPEWLVALLGIAGNIATLDENAGYFPNDIFLVPPDSVNPLQDFIDLVDGLINFEIPHIRIDLEGSGRFEVELLTIPAGGSAIIRWDTNDPIVDIMQALFDQDLSGISNTIFAELQRDFTQIPPETLERQSVDIEFENEGTHFVEVFFVPKFDYTALTFLGMGGGVRSVTACGNLRIISSAGNEINSRNYGLQQHRRDNVIMTTQDDLCKAIICGFEEIAGRIVSAQGGNIKSSIEISDDGKITIVNDSLSAGYDNIGSNSENHYGGVLFVQSKYADYINDILDYYADVNVSQSGAEYRLAQKYKMSTFLPNNIGDIWINLGNSGTPNLTALPGGMGNYLFCESSGVPTVGDIASFIVDNAASAWVEIQLIANEMLHDDQILEWYDRGSGTPTNGFQSSSCYRSPVNSVEYLASDVSDDGSLRIASLGTGETLPSGRKFRVEISGFIQNSNGEKFDGAYIVSNGVPVAVTPFLSFYPGTGNSTIHVSPSFLSPYNNDKIIMEHEITTGSTLSIRDFYWVNSADAFFDVGELSGSLSFKIYDLGAI